MDNSYDYEASLMEYLNRIRSSIKFRVKGSYNSVYYLSVIRGKQDLTRLNSTTETIERGSMYEDMNLREYFIDTRVSPTWISTLHYITAQPAHLEIHAGLSTKTLSEHIAKRYNYTFIILSSHKSQ